MSSQKAKGKRALPTVPFLRASSMSAIEVPVETPKSTKTRPIKPFKGSTATISTNLNEDKPFASPARIEKGIYSHRKNSFPSLCPVAESQTSSPRRAASNNNNCANTQKPKQRLLAKVKYVESALDEGEKQVSERSLSEEIDSSCANGEKKIARVLPMAPSPSSQSLELGKDVPSLREASEKNTKTMQVDTGLSKNFKTHSYDQGTPRTPQTNIFQLNTPGSSTAANISAPKQNMEDSCVKVAVRVRPFLQR